VIPEQDLRCPATGEPLTWEGDHVFSESRSYPVVGGVPILVADEKSLFAVADYTSEAARARPGGTLRRIRAALPSTGRNLAAHENLARLAQLVLAFGVERPRVLVVGGGSAGEGMDTLIDNPGIDLIETDVYIGLRTEIVCDGHDLPFLDGSFDAVVCQAVLEHVLDPHRVADEVHRVLKPEGLVYSEIPFMQQVHEGAYDFTRFTHLGHRRLFRCFDEIDSGVAGGPGMALAWSARYFATAFVKGSPVLRAAVDTLVSLLTFWLTYLDSFLAARPGALDAASGTFFLGRRRSSPIADGDIIASYKGAYPTPDR
jgi:SAM-dependent methyltransferase